ncbi:Transposase and inactivated derivatives, IS30 family [Bowdeniella nasicola]|uniref:Transposase and inactivated derivatives, IS30 family n=2 Tax=Bowdeniella nasicola TaxID=208480 RepID=A0A1H3Z540_9ACTO|nr:Transposase and inactivated derivatives, IS30 family [Bowdeniella nasicola]SEA73317.1 Transposase and inactivated derivatives, IS30 family [Bowdeniella nasicola]
MSFTRKELTELKPQFLDRMQVIGSATAVAREMGLNIQTAHGWARKAGLKSRRIAHQRKAEYFALRKAGHSQSAAARQIGVHVRTCRDWEHGTRRTRDSRFYADGRRVNYATGETTIETMTAPTGFCGLAALEQELHPRFLTLVERERIADLLREGYSFRAISRELGRPASTIMREVTHHRNDDGVYQPFAAHRRAAEQRPRPKVSKLTHKGQLREYVAQKLRVQWSPEQISHTLKVDYPDDESMRVSTETIYQALYVQARGGLKREIADALRTGRTRRKPRRSPEQRRERFTDPMVMISDRPAEIEDRAVPGHWEGDLITGTRNQTAIVTLVERQTRYVMLGHLPAGHTAPEVRNVLTSLIGTLPAHLRGSLTWDQGAEMAEHKLFSMDTDVPVYFCDPASPWQRGSNENTNGLLRQYFPKGTDLSVFGPADLELVAQRLNGRPRKTLDWQTPAQRLPKLVLTD